MKIRIEITLDAPAATVWEHVRTTRLLEYIAGPMIRFTPLEPPTFPDVWPEGEHKVSMRLGGFLPIGAQWIVISYPEPQDHARGVYRVRDNGRGAMISRWDHLITITARPDGRCDYVDALDLNAGVLTPFIGLFAQAFYRHRQARWRRLVASGFAYA